MKTLFIALAYGTSVRDVLRNDTFRILKESDSLRIVILSMGNCDQIRHEFAAENVYFESLRAYKTTFVERFLYVFYRAVLRRKSNTIRLGNTSGNKKSLIAFAPVADIVTWLFGAAGTNRILASAYEHFTPKKHYQRLFEKYAPDLVLCTRVLNYSLDYPVLKRAAFERVPVVVSVSSWDNLTSKGFFPFAIDDLIVWNDTMKMEAMDLFGFPSSRILVSGIPRFDIFFNKQGFRSRDQFLRHIGFGSNQRYVLYATGSKDTGRGPHDGTSPEPEVAMFIADEIARGTFGPNMKLLVRLHPQALESEYENLIQRDDVVVQIPGVKGSYRDRVFTESDDREYGETLKYSSVVVNLASTVSIDAAVFDRPIVGIDFDYRGDRSFDSSVRRYYEFDHFKKLLKTGGMKLSKSKEVLIDDILAYLDCPALDKEGRRQIVRNQCQYTDGKSGKRVAEFIIARLFSNDSDSFGN